MKYEVEQKYRVERLDKIRESLRQRGAEFRPSLEQVDRYFAHPCRDFAGTDEAFRLRRAGTDNRITYKGPKLNTRTKTRREIELPLPPGPEYLEEFSQLLSVLGFQPVAEVKKRRTPADLCWRERVIEIVLDEVDEVGCFIELELVSTPERIAEAQSLVESLAAELELTDAVRRSYLELLLERRDGNDA